MALSSRSTVRWDKIRFKHKVHEGRERKKALRVKNLCILYALRVYLVFVTLEAV